MNTRNEHVAGSRSDPKVPISAVRTLCITTFGPVITIPAPVSKLSAPAESRVPVACVPVYSTKYITSSPFGEGGRAPRCKFCGNTAQFNPTTKFCSYCGKDEYTESGGTPACDPSGACASPASPVACASQVKLPVAVCASQPNPAIVSN